MKTTAIGLWRKHMVSWSSNLTLNLYFVSALTIGSEVGYDGPTKEATSQVTLKLQHEFVATHAGIVEKLRYSGRNRERARNVPISRRGGNIEWTGRGLIGESQAPAVDHRLSCVSNSPSQRKGLRKSVKRATEGSALSFPSLASYNDSIRDQFPGLFQPLSENPAILVVFNTSAK